MNKLTRSLRQVGKASNTFQGLVIDVYFGRATVRISGNGAKYTNLEVVGGPVVVGEWVTVDFSTDTPKVLTTYEPAYAGGSGATERRISRSMMGQSQGTSGSFGYPTFTMIELYVGPPPVSGKPNEEPIARYPFTPQGFNDAAAACDMGCTMYLPPGTMAVSSTVLCAPYGDNRSDDWYKENIFVVGAGVGRTIVQSPVAIANYCTLTDFTINITGSSSSPMAGIKVMSDCYLENMKVTCTNNGSGGGYGLLTYLSCHIDSVGCDFYGSKTGYYLYQDPDVIGMETLGRWAIWPINYSGVFPPANAVLWSSLNDFGWTAFTCDSPDLFCGVAPALRVSSRSRLMNPSDRIELTFQVLGVGGAGAGGTIANQYQAAFLWCGVWNGTFISKTDYVGYTEGSPPEDWLKNDTGYDKGTGPFPRVNGAGDGNGFVSYTKNDMLSFCIDGQSGIDAFYGEIARNGRPELWFTFTAAANPSYPAVYQHFKFISAKIYYANGGVEDMVSYWCLGMAVNCKFTGGTYGIEVDAGNVMYVADSDISSYRGNVTITTAGQAGIYWGADPPKYNFPGQFWYQP
jgi:hypothetical protein